MVTIRNHNLILDGEFTHKLHPKVLYELGKVCCEDQLKFKELYNSKKRSLNLAFICLVFFPGTHYAFLGKWQLQILFWLTLGGGLVWWLIDIFRLKQLVKKNNFLHQHQILRELHSVNVFKPRPTLITPRMVEAKIA